MDTNTLTGSVVQICSGLYQHLRDTNKGHQLSLNISCIQLLRPEDMDSSLNKPKTMPAGFLKLPRELRHAILFETYNPNEPLDSRLNEVTSPNEPLHPNLYIGIFVKQPPFLQEWVMTLTAIDPRLVEDVTFIAETWEEQLKHIQKQADEETRDQILAFYYSSGPRSKIEPMSRLRAP